MSPISQRFPIPTDDDVFELICRDVLRHHWNRPDLQIFGKRGERQFGIDILDLGGGTPLYGAQCKLKEEHKSLTPAEIQDEVDKTKLFPLTLGKYGILTTGKVSTQAQLKVREINEAHKAAGLFEIELFTWERICEFLQRYTDVQETYYSDIPSVRSREIVQAVGDVREGVASLTTRVEGDSLDRQINDARDYLNRREFQIATLLLNKIQQEKWHLLTPYQRFRVLTNHGAATLAQGRRRAAAKYFLEALALQPDDEKARTNEVLAYYIVGDVETAYSKADRLIKVYPASSKVVVYWILSSPRGKRVDDLAAAFSSVLLSDAEVNLALAKKALQAHDLDRAGHYSQAAARLNPEWSQPQLTLAQLNLSRILDSEAGVAPLAIPSATLIAQAEELLSKALRSAELEKDIPSQVEVLVLDVDLALLQGKKQQAKAYADQAYRLDPDNIQSLLALSQVQLANEQLADGIGSLERAYAIERRADAAFNYGKALFTRGHKADLEIAVRVLTEIDLQQVVQDMRPTMATQALKCFIKQEDWSSAEKYLDRISSLLTPDAASALWGYLVQYQGRTQEAEKYALAAQSQLTDRSNIEVKIFLGRLFMRIGRPSDALPLFQAAFDTGISSFDPYNLLDCAARLRRDDVVLQTCESLRQRGVNDWDLVASEVQVRQKYDPRRAIEHLDDFLRRNPDHKLARLSRSILALKIGRLELLNGSLTDLPSVEDLPVEFAIAAVDVLRAAGHADEAVDYAYRFLRLHFNDVLAHSAFVRTMMPWEPLPTFPAQLEIVGIGAAVCFQELPQGGPEWRVIEETDAPSSDFDEISANSPLAAEMLGKHVGDTFLLTKGVMHDRKGIIRQIVPKYVRRFQDSGDQMQIRFGASSTIEAMHMGSTEEQMQESTNQVFEDLKRFAASDVELRKIYSTNFLPLHWYASRLRRTSYAALISLALEQDQVIRCTLGTVEERTDALAGLQNAQCVVVDMTALATLRLLGLESILAVNRLKLAMSEDTWVELRETLSDPRETSSPAIGIRFQGGVVSGHEQSAESKKERSRHDQAFLDLLQNHVQIMPALELAKLDPTRREQFEQIFGQYGAESVVLASKPDYVLWTDDLVQAQIAAKEFGTRRVWTQLVIGFLCEHGFVTAKEIDIAAAKLVGMGFEATGFDSSSMLEAVAVSDAKPWQTPLREFVRVFRGPTNDARTLFSILTEFAARLYREPLLPESRCTVITAFLDALWNVAEARRSILQLRAMSSRVFSLNPLGEAQFNDCFDSWIRHIENPIIPAT